MAITDKRYLSGDEYLRDTWWLAAQVRESGWQPDILIALWRGGAPVGVAMHEYFKVAGWNVRHIPVKCESYTGIGENAGAVKFTHGDIVFGMLRKGDKVLVVDDVFDTGKTAKAVKEQIGATGAEMRLACVYWKPGKNTTDRMFSTAFRHTAFTLTARGVFMSPCAWNHGTRDFWMPKKPSPIA